MSERGAKVLVLVVLAVLLAAVMMQTVVSPGHAASTYWKQGDPIPHAPRLEAEIAKHWKSETERKLARCVAWNESRFQRYAVGPTGDYGVFQFNRATWEPVFGTAFTDGRIYTYWYSASKARYVYDRARRPRAGETAAQAWKSRWHPWVASNFCGVGRIATPFVVRWVP